MYKSKFLNLILSVLLIFSGLLHADTEVTFSKMYVFGDSLSDTGNLASVTQPFPLPFYMNRVTNGPVAVDVLAENFSLTADASLHLLSMNSGTNYSVAGANAYGGEAIDLQTQLISFQVNHGYVAPADALYVIFIGGNDVRSALSVDKPADAETIIVAAANEVRLTVESLIQAGAKTFFIVNAPSIGLIPETQLVAEETADPELTKYAHKLSKRYRNALNMVVEQLEEDSDVDIIQFDLFKFFNKLVKKADDFGFTNSTEACFSTVNFTFHVDCNFDEFVFFDEIHPTARVHALVGDAMAEALSKDD